MSESLAETERTVDIRANGVSYEAYQFLKELKDKGGFTNWKVFFEFFKSNENISQVVISEILKLIEPPSSPAPNPTKEKKE